MENPIQRHHARPFVSDQGLQWHVKSHPHDLIRALLSFRRYVNFGVFGLYNDPCLVESLQAGLRLITLSPVPEMISFPKLSKTLFAFIHTLCTGFLPLALVRLICSLSSSSFPRSPHAPRHHTRLFVLHVYPRRYPRGHCRAVWAIQARCLGHWCVY
jgi:hypothetical protein